LGRIIIKRVPARDVQDKVQKP